MSTTNQIIEWKKPSHIHKLYTDEEAKRCTEIICRYQNIESSPEYSTENPTFQEYFPKTVLAPVYEIFRVCGIRKELVDYICAFLCHVDFGEFKEDKCSVVPWTRYEKCPECPVYTRITVIKGLQEPCFCECRDCGLWCKDCFNSGVQHFHWNRRGCMSIYYFIIAKSDTDIWAHGHKYFYLYQTDKWNWMNSPI